MWRRAMYWPEEGSNGVSQAVAGIRVVPLASLAMHHGDGSIKCGRVKLSLCPNST